MHPLDFLAHFSFEQVLWISLIFLLAGTVKGLAGFGMPLVAIPTLTLLFDVPVTLAMGWALGPIFLTNLVQVYMTRQSYQGVGRLWPLFIPMFASMLLVVQLLGDIDAGRLSVLVGLVVLVSVGAQMIRPIVVTGRWRTPFLALAGVISGLIGGLTSFMGFPAIQGMLAVQLKPNEFIFAVGSMFLVGALVIGSALASFAILSSADVVLSMLITLPAVVGLRVGQWARSRVSVPVFQRMVLLILLFNGVSLIFTGLRG